MNARVRRQPSRRGFTLIELGIVIGVTAVLAAAIVPEIIETMRNGAAQKAAADVSVIHERTDRGSRRVLRRVNGCHCSLLRPLPTARGRVGA